MYSVPIILIDLLLVLIYIFINESAQFTQSTYKIGSQHVFDRASSVLVLAYSIFASLATSYLIRDHWFSKLFESLYEYFAKQVKENPVFGARILNNNTILFQGELRLIREK